MAKIYGALEVAQLEWFTDAGKPAASSYIYRVIYVSDLKQVMVSDGSNWIPFLNTSTNQTVNGNITFAGQQIFNGLHRLSVTTDSSSTGAVTALNNVTPVIEFTGAVTSISGIVNSASGATVMLVNRTGSTLAILDEDAGATAANRIRTGTGAQVALANNASVILTYVGDNRWHIVGGSGSSTGGSGGINYITNGTAEADTVGWAVYADAAGTSPVDGTGGSANVTITRTTTTPLVGTASFLLAKDAANRQGQGWSYDFTIDLANRAKVLQISFDYLVNAGTFVAGATGSNSDVTVWIYDVTNAVVIQPSNIKLFSNNSSITDKFQASFQTSSNSSNYRLILHVASTSASAYTLEVDSVSVSPSDYVFGTPVTDWQSYTPTFQGFGTPTSVQFQWRRVGDNVEIRGKFASGTSTAVEARVSLPSGLTSSSSKIGSTQPTGGVAVFNSTGAGSFTALMDPSVSYVTFGVQATSFAGLAKLNGNQLTASGTFMAFTASVPVEGWSSSVQTSDSADTRVVTARISGAAANTSAGGILIFPTVLQDTHGAYNATTGQYRVPVSGFYQVSAYISCSNPNGRLDAYVDGNIQSPSMGYVFNSVGSGGGFTTVYANAGQLIDVRFSQTTSGHGATGGGLTFTRTSGPSAIAASETVAASGQNTAGLSIPNNSLTGLTTPTILDNSHGSLSTSGVFTAPSSGRYLVTSSVTFNANSTGIRAITIYRDGVDTAMTSASAQFSANQTSYSVSGQFRLNAGQTLQIFVFQNSGGALSLGTSGNYFSVVRVGN